MKALSVKQPWAHQIAKGRKTIETRTWLTNYRGDILIVASKTIDQAAVDNFNLTFLPWLERKEMVDNRGCAIAVARLAACFEMDYPHEEAALCRVYPGAIAWRLADVRPIKPFPVRGKLGLYEVDYKPKF